MRNIVLDFGNHQMYLSPLYYDYQLKGSHLLITSRGKQWSYRHKGFAVSSEEIRFYIEKEEEPPKLRLLPQQVKTHAK